MDTGDYPSATILYNYDTDRDAKDGLLIKKGGTGVEETGDGMYQVWRTGVLGGGLAISGDVSLDFWSALKDFKKSAAGKVTMFLRDYDPGTGHTEIGNGSALNSDWQGGSNRFVLKGITITGVDYTLSPGHELEIKLIVDATADDDMWFAYDESPYASVLTLP